MKKSISLYGFIILALSIGSNAVFAIPTLKEASATGTTFKFATKLSEKLPTGYKVKIDLNNGKGLVAMTCSGLTCSLSSNALPKLGSPTYKIGIYDAKGVLQGETTNGSYVIVSKAEINSIPTTTIPIPTTEYTKISNSGAILPDTAKLGSGSNDWACTIDNKTGLTWEVKTTDGGLHDKDWDYSWYEPDSSKNGGLAGYTDIAYGTPNCSTIDHCNTYAFVNAVNAKGLCGKNDWRLPRVGELRKLVVCSDGEYETDGNCTNYSLVTHPTINSVYFPNTKSNNTYWSSSIYAGDSKFAMSVDFGAFGSSKSISLSYISVKDYGHFVRLVR
jgi:hypothetical protein